MPRTIRRKLGARRYNNFDDDTLKAAVLAIQSGDMSQRYAAEHYHITRSTLQLKLMKKQQTKVHVGHPPIFNEDEEQMFCGYLEKVSEFGYPLNSFDL